MRNRGECTQGGQEIKDQPVIYFRLDVRWVKMTQQKIF